MKMWILVLLFAFSAEAAIDRFDAPLLVTLSEDRYLVHWDDQEIFLSHKDGRFEIKKVACNKKTFDASLLYIKSTIKVPKPSFKNPKPLRDTAMTPFDIEIKDGTRNKFFVGMNSPLGKTLAQLPTQLRFFEAEAKRSCKKK
jgi:hypothetical protein